MKDAGDSPCRRSEAHVDEQYQAKREILSVTAVCGCRRQTCSQVRLSLPLSASISGVSSEVWCVWHACLTIALALDLVAGVLAENDAHDDERGHLIFVLRAKNALILLWMTSTSCVVVLAYSRHRGDESSMALELLVSILNTVDQRYLHSIWLSPDSRFTRKGHVW